MNSRLVRVFLWFSLLFFFVGGLRAERPVRLMSLAECVQMAREYSSEALMAKHRFRAAYWRYRSYRAEFLPSLRLNGDLPNFNRRLVRYQSEDGSYKYIPENAMNISMGLSLNQVIPWTGTTLYVQTEADRSDLFGERRKTEYMTVPLQVGVRHNFFGVNELKWKKRIEPKLYEEAKREYLQRLEGISQQAANLFFEQILAQQNLAIAKLNYANADTLYQIAKGRYNIGTIAENDVLQMELNYLNAGSAVNEGEVNLQLAKFRLMSFLGLNDEFDWELEEPVPLSPDPLLFEDVLQRALENSPRYISCERQRTEAQRDIATAREQMGFQVNLAMNYGFTQQAERLLDAYKDPMDQQGIRLSLAVPILDWGRGRGRVQMARSNFEMTETRLAKEREEFRQDVFVQVMRYNMLEDQLMLAGKADTIAQNRYRISHERFLIGKIDVLELDKAQVDRDASRNSYIRAIQQSWQLYYTLRQTALYDPLTGESLEMEFESLIR